MLEKLMQNPLPIDRTAARVLYGAADHWEPYIPEEDRVTFDAPPLGYKRRGSYKLAGVRIKGMRRGKMVAWKHYGPSKSGFSRWVFRCDCGKYEIRPISLWHKHANDNDACAVCRHRDVALGRVAKTIE